MSTATSNAPRPTLRDLSALEPSALLVLPLGVGNAFTTRFYNASFLLAAGGVVTLVDAPAPLGRILREALQRAGLDGDLGVIDNVFLTHLHGDHCNGLEELGFWRFFIGGNAKPRLYIREELVGVLWQHRLRAAMGQLKFGEELRLMALSDYFEVAPISPEGPFALRGVEQAWTYPTRHGLPCAALRVHHGECGVGYSADTPFDPELIRFLEPADFIIHETSKGEVHTPMVALEGLPEETRQRIYLIHLGDDDGPIPPSLKVLEEGRLYRVTSKGC